MTGLILNPEPVDRSMAIIKKGRTVFRSASECLICVRELGLILASSIEDAAHHA